MGSSVPRCTKVPPALHQNATVVTAGAWANEATHQTEGLSMTGGRLKTQRHLDGEIWIKTSNKKLMKIQEVDGKNAGLACDSD